MSFRFVHLPVGLFFLFFLSAQLVCLPVEGWGEEGARRGRLAGGAAYRTDANGNEIVDYIAELEVTNEALERRIRGLVAEVSSLRQANERAARLRKNSDSSAAGEEKNRLGFTERELVSGEPLENTRSEGRERVVPVAAVPEKVAPEVTCDATCSEKECDIFISEVRSRGQRALAQQSEALAQQSKAMADMRKQKQECDQQFEAFRVALEAHEAEEAGLYAEANVLQEKNGSLKELLSQKDKLLAQREERLQLLQTRVSQLEQEVVRVKEEQAEADPAVVRASLRSEPEQAAAAETVPLKKVAVQKKRAPEPLPSVSDSDRKRVLEVFRKVISLRNKRDQLFTRYQSKRLSFEKQKIRSQRGELPEQLLGEVRSTQSQRRLVQLAREGKRMERLLLQDLHLLKRLRS
ncbi:hypothetical protein MRY87_12595 [bacterium]|nr:hypothetical protein [bacterium]